MHIRVTKTTVRRGDLLHAIHHAAHNGGQLPRTIVRHRHPGAVGTGILNRHLAVLRVVEVVRHGGGVRLRQREHVVGGIIAIRGFATAIGEVQQVAVGVIVRLENGSPRQRLRFDAVEAPICINLRGIEGVRPTARDRPYISDLVAPTGSSNM